MAICPSCSHNSDDDFGLVTCSSCGVQFMVGIDGAATPIDAAAAPDPVAASAEPLNETPNVSENYSVPEFADVAPPVPEDVMAVEIESPAANTDLPMDVPPLPEMPVRGVSDTSFVRTREATRPAATPDMREISTFANSDVSTGREGFLRFNIFVTGIDSADVRSELREILADSKFRWNADQLIGSIRNGELRLLEVPAVKSAIVVQRLRGLPVDVRWEQYSITQS